MYRYLKPFTETANQMLINDVRQNFKLKTLADKLDIDLQEIEEQVEQTINNLISEEN